MWDSTEPDPFADVVKNMLNIPSFKVNFVAENKKSEKVTF